MRLVSSALMASDAITPKLTPPPGDDSYFYTAGRMLTYGQPTKNGMVFFRTDCKPVLDTIQNSLSTIEHISPKNIGVEDKFGVKNSTMGSIYKLLEDDEGIDIVCKNDKGLTRAMGFSENDFNPGVGRFASYSQESDYLPINSAYITVNPSKAKSGTPLSASDIIKSYSYTEGKALGLQPSTYNPHTRLWNYRHDADGNAVFVRLRPTSFTGVGHVMMPADTTAEVYRYTANIEGEDEVKKVFGAEGAYDDTGRIALSEIPTLEMPDPAFQPGDVYRDHPDLGSPSAELSSVDAMDNFDEGDTRGRPNVPYDPENDDIYLTKDDLTALKTFSKSMSSYVDSLLLLGNSKSLSALKTPYGKNANYADPGFRGDKKRYPLDTPEHVRAAASYWGQSKNKAKYSPAERAHISARIKAAESKHKIGSHSNMAYSAVWTTPHPEKPDKFVVNRRFRMVGDDGNLDREKLLAAYHALSGTRGHTGLTHDMPGPVRDHALALVRQGLNKTKSQIKEKSMSTTAADLTPELNREIQELTQKAQDLSSAKDASATELTSVKAEFSSFKEAQETLVKELKDTITERETEIAAFKAKELSNARLAQLEAVLPLTDEEKAEEKLKELMSSLSSVSDDRMETMLVRRELAKAQADRAKALSSFGGGLTISPAPKFENPGNEVENKVIDPVDYL